MAEMLYKEQPAAARKAKVLEIMDRAFAIGTFPVQLSPNSYDDIQTVKGLVGQELAPYYGERAVRNTFNTICKEKGWAYLPPAKPKPEKNGLGARMDQIDSRMSSGEAAIMELGKRIEDLAGIVKDAFAQIEGLTARIAAIEKDHQMDTDDG